LGLLKRPLSMIPSKAGAGHGTNPFPWSGHKRHRALCGSLSGSGWESGFLFGRPQAKVCESMGQCAIEVFEEVLDVFDADGEANGAVGDSRLGAFLWGERGMAHCGRVGDERFNAAEALGKQEDLQRL